MLQNSPKQIWIKATALFIAGLFILETAIWAAPAPFSEVTRGAFPSARDDVRIPSLVEKVRIPSALGSVQEVFQASVAGAASLIYLEEAHGEPEAQKNILAILELLREKHGIQTFFLEGAWSRLEPRLLSFSNDEHENEKILSDLTEKAIVGGPENFLYRNSQDKRQQTIDHKLNIAEKALVGSRQSSVMGYGIENVELYKKNLEQFRAVLRAKEQSETFLNEMKKGLLTKASQTLNPELAEYFRQWSFQEEVQRDYGAHLRVLANQAEKQLGIDLNDPREQYDWPQLVRFQKLKELEKYNAQSTAYSEEKKKLGAWLQNKNLVLPEQMNLLLSDEAHGTNYDLRSFFESFYEKAAPAGFKFKDYPALSKEWGKQILAQELDAPALLKEASGLEDRLLEKLAQKPDEIKLIQKYREYLMLKKLLHLEISRDEWRGLGSQSLVFGSKIDATIRTAKDFYATAEERDAAMFSRTIEWIQKEKIQNAVIITGGFHAQGMSDLFKQKNISYLRIQPRITQIHGRENYLKLMMPAASHLRMMSPAEPNPIEPQPWRKEIPTLSGKEAGRSENRHFFYPSNKPLINRVEALQSDRLSEDEETIDYYFKQALEWIKTRRAVAPPSFSYKKTLWSKLIQESQKGYKQLEAPLFDQPQNFQRAGYSRLSESLSETLVSRIKLELLLHSGSKPNTLFSLPTNEVWFKEWRETRGGLVTQAVVMNKQGKSWVATEFYFLNGELAGYGNATLYEPDRDLNKRVALTFFIFPRFRQRLNSFAYLA